MEKRHISASILLAVLIVISVFSFSSCAKKKAGPANYIADAIEATIDSKTAEGFMPEFVSSVKEFRPEGSASVVINLPEPKEGESPNPYDSLILNFYAKDNRSAGDVKFKTKDGSTTLKFWQDKAKYAMSSSLIDNVIYGIDLGSANDKYAGSGLAQMDSQITTILGEDGENIEIFKKLSDISDQLRKLYDNYKDTLIELINKYAVTEMESEDGGKTASFELNNENMKKIMKDLYDKAKADEDLRTVLNAIMAELRMFPENDKGSIDIDKDFDWDDFFASEEELNDMFDDMDGTQVSFKLVIHTDKNDLIKTAEISVSSAPAKDTSESLPDLGGLTDIMSGETSLKITLDMTDPKKSVLSLKMVGNEAPELLTGGVTITYEVKSETEKEYKSALSLKMTGIEIELVNIDYSKETKEYTVFSPIGKLIGGIAGSEISLDLSIKGTFEYDKSKAVFTLKSLSLGKDNEVKTDIKVTLSDSCEVPEFPKEYKDIIKETKEALEDIQEKLEDGLEEVIPQQY